MRGFLMVRGLFDTSDTRVQFFHSLVILIVPYLGLVMGARPAANA